MLDLRLYAINAKDQPLLQVGEDTYYMFSMYQQNISPDAWLIQRFYDAGGDDPLTFNEFPSLLVSNWQPPELNPYRLDIKQLLT